MGHYKPYGFLSVSSLRLQPTCRVLRGHGSSVEDGSVLGDGPHLVGSTDGDGLEGLVGADVQPGAALVGPDTQRSEQHHGCLLVSEEAILTAGFCGLTPSRQSTSPLSLSAHTGTCSIRLWARHGIREMSLRGMGGTCCHGPLTVILHFLYGEHTWLFPCTV